MKEYMLSHKTKLSMFDTYVGCILNYACEIWGYHTAPDIEKVHLLFLKNVLGVKKTVNSSMVYFELGRYPLCLRRKMCMIKYWLNLLRTNNCILLSCYDELIQLHRRKPNCKEYWIFHVKN